MSWTLRTLDELGSVSRGRSRHRPRDAAHLYGGPYPFVQTGDVKHSTLHLTSYSQTYSEAGLAQSRLWNAGTLCITIAANIAETAILGIDACFPDSVIGFVPEDDKADARFIKYLFDTMLKKRFKQFTQGAAQDNLSQEKLLSLRFPVPEITEQRRIASILSAYDDLIENNRRRIELLEQSARLLYKEWFVHLRFPGHEHTTITDGVPEGWEEGTVGDIGTRIKVSYTMQDEDLPLVDLSRIRSKTLSVVEVGTSGDLGTSRTIFEVDDVLFSSIRPYLHKVILAPFKGITNTSVFVVRANESYLRAYLAVVLSSDYAIAYANQHATGTKMPVVKWASVATMPALVPSKVILEHFEIAVAPALAQIKLFHFLNQRLSQARDLLLPRLMNGGLSV